MGELVAAAEQQAAGAHAANQGGAAGDQINH
jgi:hypothetical protein